MVFTQNLHGRPGILRPHRSQWDAAGGTDGVSLGTPPPLEQRIWKGRIGLPEGGAPGAADLEGRIGLPEGGAPRAADLEGADRASQRAYAYNALTLP